LRLGWGSLCLVDDLMIAGGMEGGNFIYSQWPGYKAEEDVKVLLEFTEKKGMRSHEIHTSGHADRQSLQKIVDSLKPKALVPIHTENQEGYECFGAPVYMLEDGEEKKV
jgi:ribonuclease J